MLTLKLRTSLHPIFELEALASLSPKWTLRVAYALRGRVLRFRALQSELQDISPKMLASSLKVLVEFGLVQRRQYETIPPRVDYWLTEMGEELVARLVLAAALMTEAHRHALSQRLAEAAPEGIGFFGRRTEGNPEHLPVRH